MSTRRATEILPEASRRDLPGQIRLSEQYHEASKYRRSVMFRDGPRIVPEVPSPEETGICLPAPQPLMMDLDRALTLRRSHRRFASQPLDQGTLATLLGHACERGTYPSAGARYAVSVYVMIAATGTDLSSGLYRYRPEYKDLIPEPCDIRRFRLGLMPSGDPEPLEAVPVFLCFVAHFSRMQQRYGERGYRFCLQECGHMCQNVQLVCAALGLGSLVLGAYVDDEIHRALRLDGTEKAVLAIMPVGLSEEEEK